MARTQPLITSLPDTFQIAGRGYSGLAGQVGWIFVLPLDAWSSRKQRMLELFQLDCPIQPAREQPMQEHSAAAVPMAGLRRAGAITRVELKAVCVALMVAARHQ